LCHAAEHGARREARHRQYQHPLAAEPACEPPRQRRHDGCRHDVGGQHPIHLLERSRQIAADVRQRYVRYGRIHRLQDGGESDGGGNEPAMLRLAQFPAPAGGRSVPRERVSTLTLALSPERTAGRVPSRRSRTSSRCTTFTQLPVAFSGGRTENCEPVPGVMLVTTARKVLPGYASIFTVAESPACMW